MNKRPQSDDFGVPDDDSPEITAEDMRWFVKASDFGGADGVHDFLTRRTAFLKAAEAVGIAREAFLPFEPSKPGFEDRARQAFEAFLNATRQAAE